MRAMRIGQIVHIVLLVAVVVLYAVLKAVLPPDDPDRTRINLTMTVVVAAWGALVFISLLSGKPEGSFRQRALGAYRRLLNRPWTLAASDFLLGLACAATLYLLIFFRPVEIFSVSDVDVFLDDPGTTTRRLGSVTGNSSRSFRLHVGDRWLAFETKVSRDQTILREAGYATRVQVRFPWCKMEPLDIPELLPYEHLP